MTVVQWRRDRIKRSKSKGVSKNKYGAKRTKDGYDSGAEGTRAKQLQYMLRGGLITDLVLDKKQLRYEIIPKQVGYQAVHYTADARYVENGEIVVEDTKSPATAKNAAYILRKKLMLHVHGIRIREIMK